MDAFYGFQITWVNCYLEPLAHFGRRDGGSHERSRDSAGSGRKGAPAQIQAFDARRQDSRSLSFEATIPEHLRN
jgi:hypothetical protein